jgi:phosphomevalonate kinase
VLWTGVPVRTSELIRAVKAFAARDPNGMVECMNAIREAAGQFESALRAGSADDTVRAVRAHARAMDRLGSSSDAAIVTKAMRQLGSAVEPLGGAIKPSGAGGGDIVFATAHDATALDAVIRAGREHGFVPLDLTIDPHGARTIAGDTA